MSSKAENMQDMPTHYAALEWIVGFGEYMFDGNMECFKKMIRCLGWATMKHLFVMEQQLRKTVGRSYLSSKDSSML
jgi:hypothetical protein